MRCQFMLRFSAVALLCLTTIVSAAVTKRDTIYTQAGDAIMIDYDVTIDEGNAVVSFKGASIALGQSNKSYRRYQDSKSLKVIFIDGWNFEDNYKIEVEKGRRVAVKPFTTPSGWSYKKDATKNSIFPINDTGQRRLTFEGIQGKFALKIPVYLAIYEHQDAKKILLRKASTTYTVFAESRQPLTIEIANKPAKKAQSRTNSEPKTATKQEEVVDYEDVDITTDDNVPGIAIEQIDQEALALINRIESSLATCETEEDYSRLDVDLGNLDKYWSGASTAVKGQIDDLKNRVNTERKGAAAAAAAAAAAEQESMAAQAEEEAKKQEDANRKDKWWMFIIAAVLGVLGFGGSQVAQHVRNSKNQQSMMDMQQSVVRRAENEAKRRAQSYARNKTHQMVGQAKQKGRQAVRSNVNKIGDNVKGRKQALGNDGENQAETPQRASNSIGQRPIRGPKKNKNGEISI